MKFVAKWQNTLRWIAVIVTLEFIAEVVKFFF